MKKTKLKPVTSSIELKTIRLQLCSLLEKAEDYDSKLEKSMEIFDLKKNSYLNSKKGIIKKNMLVRESIKNESLQNAIEAVEIQLQVIESNTL